ncbi:transglycosylase domain-containing protein [Pontibacter sp. 172403-2]|uniref:biosynthetic peptidoglycan transglycosylase n=1 Tax=Pontibacter rufus TaxID=2791028 RepID=UPI0018B013C9|nr:biosynthetic peptidoglycan transglycosylase [Pontibacter sp. 172403-2]MBF9255329.1 transglycosylase domain-containing protein [Pontibacter sp. 172403-2]
MKKKILWWAGGVLAFFLVVIALLLIFRSRLLDYAIQRVVAKVEAKYPADLNIKNADFVDLNSVLITGISFVPDNRDTLFVTDSVYATVSIRSIFRGSLVFKRLEVRDGYLTAVKKENQNNYSFLLEGNKAAPPDTSSGEGRNYGELLNRLIETAFDNVPDLVDFNNLNVSYHSTHRTIDIKMPYLKMDDGHFDTQLAIRTDSLVNKLRVTGTIDPGKYKIAANLYATGQQDIKIPYIKDKYNAEVSFDTLHLSLTDKTFKQDKLTVRGRGQVSHLVVNQPKLSDEDIRVKEAAVNYVVTLGPDLYVIDSLTEVRVNEVKANVYAAYHNADAKIIDLRVKTGQMQGSDFFNSLPQGLFENLEGIKAKGTLQYKMSFHLNMDSVDRVKFNSDLDASKDFKIVQWGNTNIEKINGSFVHTVYEYGKPVRTFVVGPSNPFYARLNEISPYLRNAILTAEDAFFYTHKGFHEEAFRQAIAKNIKEGEFARGASTISMQLVKNVFLTRKKTVARKVEEAIIVWLIENLDLVSKNRMFEVYLNIIEWGPNVYGAKDASRFYFGKQPSELNLAEAIFLTSIIPSPKNYRASFDSHGNLRNWKSGYYRLIGGNMLRRGLISREAYDNLYPNVQLYGRARDLIVTEPDTTSIQEDSIKYELETIDLLDF